MLKLFGCALSSYAWAGGLEQENGLELIKPCLCLLLLKGLRLLQGTLNPKPKPYSLSPTP